MVSLTTSIRLSFSAFRSVWSRSLVEKASKVLAASIPRRQRHGKRPQRPGKPSGGAVGSSSYRLLDRGSLSLSSRHHSTGLPSPKRYGNRYRASLFAPARSARKRRQAAMCRWRSQSSQAARGPYIRRKYHLGSPSKACAGARAILFLTSRRSFDRPSPA